MGRNAEEKHIFIKPNFVTDIYDRLSKENRIVSDKYCIYVGRIEKSKGILELAEAWKGMKDVPLLVICGGGPEEEELKEIIAGQENIISTGTVSHDRVVNLIFYAEALIFPSRLYEGIPMTILESMMCGTPVICRNIGNGADIVKKVKKDMLYNTKEELHAILRMKRYQDYGKDFREAYLTSYSPDANYEMYREILQEVEKLENRSKSN